MEKVAVLGAGSWGTALAVVLAQQGSSVYLWARDPHHIQGLSETRVNKRYLPAFTLPTNISYTSELAIALNGAQFVVLAIPSHAFRTILKQLKPVLLPHIPLVGATKGLDPDTGGLLHTVVKEILGAQPYSILSGPSFAKEVAHGLPTAITLATDEPVLGKKLLPYFHSARFRVYLNSDLVGVEISGTVKNVLAVATGISDGLGYGANARAALITRGLAEMMRLGLAMGGQRETFMGLAGLGDLVLTCTDNQSRNRRLGLALGRGATVVEAQREIGQVVESIGNTRELLYLAQHHSVEMPIVSQVACVIRGTATPAKAVQTLMSREPKEEVSS